MKKRHAAAALLCLVSTLLIAQDEDINTLVHQVDARIVVLDAEGVAWELADWAERTGGYFTRVSTDNVNLRIPSASVAGLRPQLEGVAETVLQYDPRAFDVREELASVETGISSREESLDLILSYLAETDVAATLDLEREVSALVNELENLKGRRKRLLNDTAYARVTVYLGSRQQTIPERIPSSFEWINTMGLYGFLEEAMPYGY
jgi:hypothetical protein